MKKLPPLVSGVDGRYLKTEPLEEIDFEFLGYLLSCHLVLEHHIDEFVMTLGPKLKWERARLSFSQKLSLFPMEIFPNGETLLAGLKHINKMRNKAAHNIKVREDNMKFEPLLAFLRLSIRNDEKLPDKPLEILELFTNLACAGFLGWVASDAYRTNWRNEK